VGEGKRRKVLFGKEMYIYTWKLRMCVANFYNWRRLHTSWKILVFRRWFFYLR